MNPLDLGSAARSPVVISWRQHITHMPDLDMFLPHTHDCISCPQNPENVSQFSSHHLQAHHIPRDMRACVEPQIGQSKVLHACMQAKPTVCGEEATELLKQWYATIYNSNQWPGFSTQRHHMWVWAQLGLLQYSKGITCHKQHKSGCRVCFASCSRLKYLALLKKIGSEK